MDIVQIDHTLVDVMVVDREHRLMPPEPNLRDLYEETLSGMGGVFSPGTSVTTLRHRIHALAEQLEVRMLIIDEIHALLVGTPRQQRIILTAIRLLANDLRSSLVCLGIEEPNRALVTDDQLADRFAAAELPAWENDEAFEQLLLSFESTLPLRQPSEFRDPKVRQRILSLTQGVLGRVCRLMETAAVEAVRSIEQRITLALLKEELVTESLVYIADRQMRRSIRVSRVMAPAELPFAPRPYSDELLSSWLLRVGLPIWSRYGNFWRDSESATDGF
jgi:hypothetical protein